MNDFADFDDDFFPEDYASPPEHLEETGNALPVSVSDIDLLRPPGFVGKVTDWIDSQCRYPRRRLAVASALVSVGNIGGLRHDDARDGVSANMLAFCVAASATGKEAVQQAMAQVHIAAGVSPALQGSIKSEQEIVRNLIEHQAAFYIVDEIGIFLSKVRNAQRRGGAAYLEGVFGAIMSAYSKATARMLLNGDTRRELRKVYSAALFKAQDDGDAAREERAERMLRMVDEGFERPFLSVVGFTTPGTFDGIMDGETATQGFVGRALIVNERDTNPAARVGFSRPEMPLMMATRLAQIYSGGDERVEHTGERFSIPTDADADAALDAISAWLLDYADEAAETTGEASVAMVRRAYELIAKVSFVLAIPDERRTLEHVRWAFAYVKQELDAKIKLVFANDNARARPDEALAARIMNLIDEDKGVSIGVMTNRLKVSESDLSPVLKKLADAGAVIKKNSSRKYRGRVVEKWFLLP